MKFIAKAALGALMLAGTAAAVATPASAGWSFGIGFGPGYYGPPPPYYARAYCDPWSRYYDPYYCDDYDYYYGPPVFVDGFYYGGPLRSRWYGGHREFWVRNGWHGSDRYNGGGRFVRGGGGHWGGGGHGGSWSGGSHWSGGHGGHH